MNENVFIFSFFEEIIYSFLLGIQHSHAIGKGIEKGKARFSRLSTLSDSIGKSLLPYVTYWDWLENRLYISDSKGTAVVNFTKPQRTVLPSTEIKKVNGKATPGLVYFDHEVQTLYVADSNGDLNIPDPKTLLENKISRTGSAKKGSIYYDVDRGTLVVGQEDGSLGKPDSPTIFENENPLLDFLPSKTNGLISLWNLDETSGNSVGDLVGENNGIIVNAIRGIGINGNALEFGGNGYAGGNQKIVNGYPFSVTAWFKTDLMGKNDRVIFGLANNSSNKKYCGVFVDKTGKGGVLVRNGDTQKAFGGNSVDDSSWHHVVGVFASSTDRRVYLDGQFMVSDTAKMDFDSGVNSWSIGRWGEKGTKSDYFEGSIDEVKIYETALSDETILEQYLSYN